MRGIEALAFLAAIGAAHGQSTVGFGPYFSLGPTQSWIREANTTLVLPEAPSPQKDRLALWPGMGTSGGDLIQALAVSFSDPNAAGQWCTWASTLEGTQLGGKEVPASAGDKITMHCSGQAQGWGTAVECQDDACQSTAAAHEYLDTTIILNAADSTFGNTLAINEATSSGLTTSDNGKTWTVSTININSHTYDL
ncbi:hypothetical protein ASPCADRAFT_52564 [Aspergillus carbonarius ITEM 5010]|uniref:Uncharacterized protein n=1 Tax=Aspergillus carbonarius (strain ITEM 5010) TaxID=602072 RepID=A0A1R3RHH6_ASPC5|nr:hypothetical protein ASPCADRAFT_52564 [Aspergillus carbonarius ITEM 5010]